MFTKYFLLLVVGLHLVSTCRYLYHLLVSEYPRKEKVNTKKSDFVGFIVGIIFTISFAYIIKGVL